MHGPTDGVRHGQVYIWIVKVGPFQSTEYDTTAGRIQGCPSVVDMLQLGGEISWYERV